jgi:phosphate transport system substrate-binding protein
MNKNTTRRLAFAAAALLAVSACGGSDNGEGGSDLTGTILIDGSSTVAPLLTLYAEDFQAANAGVRVTVGTSGTGGGFEKFCAGETDISNASRSIKDSEKEACAAAGIEFYEIQIANDALSVVVNPDNDWAACLTMEQLATMWSPESEGKVTNWNQIDPSFPDQKLNLFGAGTDSGTFDYFTGEVNGDEGASRTDYSPSEDDNVTITGVTGDKGAVGYFGYSYLEENLDKVKAVAIDSGNGCVEPSIENVQAGDYTPLARPLFIYVKKAAAARAEMKAFLEFVYENQDAIIEEALYVPLNDAQKTAKKAKIDEIVAS